MAGKSKAFLCLAFINIFGLTRTMAEYKEKRKLQWFVVVAFGFIFFIVGGIGVLELLRASDILVDIENLKDEIAVVEQNLTETRQRKREVLTQLREVKTKILKASCTGEQFSFWDKGLFCIKRDITLRTREEAVNYCESVGDGLFKLDSVLKYEMLTTSHPIDKMQGNVHDPYWVDGNVENGKAMYSDGREIPNDYRFDPLGTDPCFVIQKGQQFKFENRRCEETHFGLCEIMIKYEKDDVEIEAEERSSN